MAKYTREINCATNLRASLDEAGNFSLRARARMPYAPDQAPDAVVGAEVEVPEKFARAVQEAMAAALEAVGEPLAKAVDTNAAVARDAARRNGEVK
jgi:hypothetical protein